MREAIITSMMIIQVATTIEKTSTTTSTLNMTTINLRAGFNQMTGIMNIKKTRMNFLLEITEVVTISTATEMEETITTKFTTKMMAIEVKEDTSTVKTEDMNEKSIMIKDTEITTITSHLLFGHIFTFCNFCDFLTNLDFSPLQFQARSFLAFLLAHCSE